ncbi:uncharacterized protein LOC110716185 isoform X2 [Chenopodium quinoa]|uniref:uncharacterized protein LOC110716185 isoform X2 n=1 Tax=Chenopodium quinoa TaxID=63459 RepID=UPI000B779EFA|nr:uncharacterized protein LOC110716185 isoform X2 [Chenopodium quinoa]
MSKNRKFGADGVIYAELNKVFKRELTEDSYSGGEVRVTPMCTLIIIRATCGKGRRIKESCFLKMDECDVANFIAICWAIYGARNSQIMEEECRDYREVLSYAIKTGNSKPVFCCAAAVGSGKAAFDWTTYAGLLKVNVDDALVGDIGCGLG